MSISQIVLCVLGYLVIAFSWAGAFFWLDSDKVFDVDHIAAGMFWPISMPFILVGMLFDKMGTVLTHAKKRKEQCNTPEPDKQEPTPRAGQWKENE